MRSVILCWLLALASSITLSQQYDLVIEGGRVLDPETGLDATRNVGITDGKIARISSDLLRAKRVIRAGGLVIAPASSICISMDKTSRAVESRPSTA